MDQLKGLIGRRAALMIFVVVLMALGLSPAAWADLHIIMESQTSITGLGILDDDGDTQEFFMRDNKIAVLQPEGEVLLVDCVVGDFALMFAGSDKYWRGTPAQMRAEIQAIFAELAAEMPEGEFDWVDEVFGSGIDAVSIPVRTTRIGSEAVLGYDAIQYRVEYQEDGQWHHFDDVWAAPGLLRDVRAEVGDCLNATAREAQQIMVGLAVGGEADALLHVLTSPEYAALADEGFPIRNRSTMPVSGTTHIETTSQVTAVNRSALPADMFVIPDHYEQISLLEAMMPQ